MKINNVITEFVEAEGIFKWRLTNGEEHSDWTSHYEGILTHTFKDGSTWGLATDYWSGSLPVEVPFQIITSKE